MLLNLEEAGKTLSKVIKGKNCQHKAYKTEDKIIVGLGDMEYTLILPDTFEGWPVIYCPLYKLEQLYPKAVAL